MVGVPAPTASGNWSLLSPARSERRLKSTATPSFWAWPLKPSDPSAATHGTCLARAAAGLARSSPPTSKKPRTSAPEGSPSTLSSNALRGTPLPFLLLASASSSCPREPATTSVEPLIAKSVPWLSR